MAKPASPQARKPVLPRLYAIVDVEACAAMGLESIDVARAFLQGGVRLLQVRARTLESGPFLDLLRVVVGLAAPLGGTVIANDRADLAVLAGAAGVHVGQDDLRALDVRRLVGSTALVGLSTHTDAQVDEAVAQPVDYIAIGPVFSTLSKATGHEPVGLDAVARTAERAGRRGLPVVAIGGITLETAPSVIRAGAASVAVIGDLLIGDLAGRARAYLATLAA